MPDEPFELNLTGMAHGGAALGRYDGRVIFVPYTLPGERVSARITEDKGRFARGEALQVLDASPDRVSPRCPHFGPGRCGGCQWQHVDYPAQLALKQEVMIDQLQRIGKFEQPNVLPTLPSPHPWTYRAHMTFSVTGAGELGFWSTDNSQIIPIDECHILHPTLLDVLYQLDLSAPTLKRVRLQIGSDPTDVMLVIETSDDLAPELEIDLPVSVNLRLSDNEPVNLIGRTHVVYQVAGRAFRVTAGAFFQANPPVAEMLVQQVMARLALQGSETVLDLYSGVGLFTAFLAERAEAVVSVESYPAAVTDAESNLDEFDNVDILEGNAEDVLPDWPDEPLDAVVVDPPRTGLSVEVIDALGELSPARFVYVSCDPATLARDGARLANKGYRLHDVQPLDMFPQTFHVESVSLFVRA
jgi:23S rRNA (uracil1939-C5)-methyltransferase